MHIVLIGAACLLILAFCLHKLMAGKRLRDVKKDRGDVAEDLEVTIERQKLKKDRDNLKKQEDKL